MSILKENQQASNIFFITFKIINSLQVFTNKKYYQVILDSLKFCRKNKGWKIYAYTILINHLHLVIKILPNFNLDDTVRDFKSFTAKEILKLLREDNHWGILREMKLAAKDTKKQNFKVWRKNIWPKAIVSKKFFLQKVKYTNLNAQKHKIVNDMEKYPYSSYHNHYCDHKTFLEIDDIKGIL